jgi:hypothetical protein
VADSNETYSVYRGTALPLGFTFVDSSGDPQVNTYVGTEPLTATVWPGGNRAAAFAPTVAWDVPAAATGRVTLSAAQTATLDPGDYQLVVKVTTADGLSVAGYSCTVVVLASAGTAVEPPTYCTYDELLKYARGWLKQLATDDDESGFAEQRHRARTWIEDIGHAHFRTATLAVVVGGAGWGPRRGSARSTWLQAQFDADYLMLTDQIRECAAHKALHLVCAGQIGAGGATDYGKLARYYGSRADYLGSCLVLSLDTDGDGEADVTIDCTSTDPLYG